jgi:hypothetical protein
LRDLQGKGQQQQQQQQQQRRRQRRQALGLTDALVTYTGGASRLCTNIHVAFSARLFA